MPLSTCGRRHCEGAGRGSPGLWIHCLIEKALGIENMGWEGSEEELAGGTFFQSAEIFDRESSSKHLPSSALLTARFCSGHRTVVLSPIIADALFPWICFAHEEPRHSLLVWVLSPAVRVQAQSWTALGSGFRCPWGLTAPNLCWDAHIRASRASFSRRRMSIVAIFPFKVRSYGDGIWFSM